MEYLMWFIVSFIIVFTVYNMLYINKTTKKDKMTSEAKLVINSFNLDINKFSYRKFIKILGIIISIDVALVSTVVIKVNGFIWQILFGLVIIIPIVLITFMLFGKYYQKKQLKDNKKEIEKENRYNEKIEKKKNKKKKGKKKNG